MFLKVVKSMIKIIFAFLFTGLNLLLLAQHSNFNSQRNWSLNKKELQFGIGATQFNGDLGGSAGIGRDYSIKDIDIQATGLAAWLGYRKRFHPFFATTSSICVFQLRGNDNWAEEPVRNARSLNFKSLCFEVQQRLEFIFLSKEVFGSIHNLPGNYSKKSRNFQTYIFSGLGLIYFNPRSEYIDGSMVSLRPLKTEGQLEMYSPFSLTIPAGIGFRIGLDRTWRIGLELAYIKTFTDYIDDVSTTYADPKSFDNQQAAYFSNPTNGLNPVFKYGEKRGDSNHKDAYYHLNVIFTRNITFKRFGLTQKSSSKYSDGRYKI